VLDPLIGALQQLGTGELTLIAERESPAGAAVGQGSLLVDRVRGSQAATLLAGIHVADSLDQALALRPQLAAGMSVVTADGVWIGPNWVQVARGKNAAAGVLKRKQELAELALQLEELEAPGDNLSVRQTVQETERSSPERRRQTLSRTIAERQRQYAELRS